MQVRDEHSKMNWPEMFKDTTKEMKNTFDGHITRLNTNKKGISNLKVGKEKVVRMKYKEKKN